MARSSAESVSLRLRCLYVLFLRVWAEAKKKKRGDDWGIKQDISGPDLYERCLAALKCEHLRGSFTGIERRVIATRLGGMPNYRMNEGWFRAEAIEVLAWALGKGRGLPSIDRRPSIAFTGLSIDRDLSAKPAAWLAQPALRPHQELVERQEFEQAWAWRARLALLRLTIAFHYADDLDQAEIESKQLDEFLDQVVAERTRKLKGRGWFKPVRNDFPFGRRTFASVFDKDLSPGRSFEPLVNERLRAANWLLRPAQAWHSTSTRTPLGFTIPVKHRGDMQFLKKFLDPKDDSRWYY
jgi:hypothetical protein